MSRKEILVIDYFIEKKKDSESIWGQLFFPIVDDVVYKAIRATVNRALLSDAHRLLLGVESQDSRDAKDMFISKHCKSIGMGSYESLESFTYPSTNVGLVKFSGDLLGYHTNKSINFFVIAPGTSVHNAKVPMMFGTAKTTKEKFDFSERHITISEAIGRKIL